MRFAKYLSIFIIFLLLGTNVYGQMRIPRQSFYTIESKHFSLHLPHHLLNPSALWLWQLEKHYTYLSLTQNWHPDGKIEVILLDSSDLTNGYATPFPFNKMEFFAKPPDLDSDMHNFVQWSNLLIPHELTHIMNLDHARGLHALVRSLFGRVSFPNSLLPLWMLEGNAVHQESIAAQYTKRETIPNRQNGRNHSAYVNMIIRNQILSAQPIKLHEITHFVRRWPGGSGAYYYGGRFVQFIDQYFSPFFTSGSAFSHLFYVNSNNILPYLHNKNSRDFLQGYTFSQLFQIWQKETIQKYQTEYQQLQKKKTNQSKRLTRFGHFTAKPRFSKDGKYIYFIRRDPYTSPSLCRIEWKPKQAARKLECSIALNYGLDYTLIEKKGILWADIEIADSTYIYGELFQNENVTITHDLAQTLGENYHANWFSFSPRQLSQKLRLQYLDSVSDGNKQTWITYQQGQYSLQLLFREQNKWQKREILSTKDPLAFCRLSPDGQTISFIRKSSTGQQILMLYIIPDRKFFQVNLPLEHTLSASWHPHFGKENHDSFASKIILSGQKDGYYNLFSLDLQTKTMEQWTQNFGGSLHPEYDPSGQFIAFSYYTKDGWDIHLMDLRQKQIIAKYPIEISPKEKFTEGTRKTIPQQNQSHPSALSQKSYSVWPSILPRFFIPSLSSTQLSNDQNETGTGVYLFGTDALYRHQYFVWFEYLYIQNSLNMDITYSLDYFLPLLNIGYSHSLLPLKTNPPQRLIEKIDLYQAHREQKIFITASLPWIYMRHWAMLQGFYSYGRDTYEIYYNKQWLDKSIYDNHEIIFALYYDSTQSPSYAIIPQNGQRVLFTSTFHYEPDFEWLSKNSYRKYDFFYNVSLPSFWNNHQWLGRLRIGYLDNAAFFYENYTNSGSQETHLRGYPDYFLQGSRMVVAGLSYHFPIWQPDWGHKMLPFLLRDLSASLFVETGQFHSNTLINKAAPFAGAYGGEVQIKITLGYHIDFFCKLGYAQGWANGGEKQIYFSVFTGDLSSYLRQKQRWLRADRKPNNF